MKLKRHQDSGFTLIEILIVIVIVSIMTVLGVQMINSGSIERTVQQQVNQFKASFAYSCDQASLQNRIYGLKIFQNGYSFSTLVNQQWQDVLASEALANIEFDNGIYFDLSVDGRVVELTQNSNQIPQIICDSSGEISAFVLNLHNSSNASIYQLKPKDFWSLEGRWLDET
jgi:general secretion pathway protein H